MYNQPYFIPSYFSNMVTPSMMRGAMGMGGSLRGLNAVNGASKSLGLFSRLGNGFSAIRGINWGNFITNTSKTLGVINQTIPLVRQVGPVFNNMKSMLKIASLFKDETDNRANIIQKRHSINSNNTFRNNNFQVEQKESSLQTNSNYSELNYGNDDYSPTFFINS